jgi:GTP diphosphokinase / guanosine-3',5'-bis(diphosphate) 3'-diphosphatase
MAGADGLAPATAGEAAPAAPKRATFLRQFELVERVHAYDPTADEAAINRAYVYATVKHGGQKRHSGDPYFAHPIQVAGILTEYRLDVATIIAGLLHDTVEDTDATIEEIRAKFGDTIAELVEGVTKLSKLEQQTVENTQAANLQKFILAMSKDVRVLLVKLADRLHNMRTLKHHPKPESRKRIALETMDIYAPLARRIGMDRMAGELEDLSFKEAYPDVFAALSERTSKLSAEKGHVVKKVSDRLRETLADFRPPARVYGREKTVHSIWRKLRRKSMQFSDLADIYAFRVVVDSPAQCYEALGRIHAIWRCVPEALEDYISNPKPNGYRSIHTIVIGPGNVRMEIQIRTQLMDWEAEMGVAAHWRYKNESYGFDEEGAAAKGIDPREAVRSLLEIAEHGGDLNEYIEHTKLEMYSDHVFAYTPRGRLIALPQGATALDFAYAVHSELGDRCIGARLNGEDRPLRTPLQNGDVVEIVTSQRAAPVPGWASLTKTGRAKSAQRRLERLARREEFIRLGRGFVEVALKRIGHDLQDTDLEEAVARLQCDTVDDLFFDVGEGRLKPADVAAAAFPGLTERIQNEEARAPIEDVKARAFVSGGDLTPGVSLHFAPCCSPIPGDRIVGVLEGGAGVVIHTIDCETLAARDAESVEWIDLAWTDEAKAHGLAVSRILAVVQNTKGALAQLCKIIAENDGNILNVRTAKRAEDFFDLVFDVEVADLKHMTNILAAMRSSKMVRDVERARS